MPLRLSTLLVLSMLAQQAPASTALVVGRVLDQTDDKPVSGAVVEIASEAVRNGVAPAESNPPRRQMTDGLGRFVFRDLPGGVYVVRVMTGGGGFTPNGFIQSGSGFPISAYLEGGFGQRRPGGALQPMVVAEGQSIPDLVIRLWRGAAISGSVIDDTGEPVVDTVVGAAQVSSDGRLINGPTVRTDDRGLYRLSALVPGNYVVFVPQVTTAMSAESAETAMQRIAELSAAQRPGAPVPTVPELTGIRVGPALVKTSSAGLINGNTTPRRDGDAVFVFQTTFHPSAATLGSAAAVVLASGDDRTGVDISMQPVRASSITGTVLAGGTPASGIELHLMPASSMPDASLFETAIAQTDGQGRFTFPLVPVGNYTVKALNAPQAIRPAASAVTHNHADAPGAWLSESVGVGPDGVKDVVWTLRPGFSVQGQIDFAGSSARPADADMLKITLALRSAQPRARADIAGGGAQAAPLATGTFAAVGIPPGRYVLRAAAVPTNFPWRIQSVIVNGRESVDLPFEVTEDISNVRVIFTDRPAAVSGRVTSAEPGDAGVAVLLFPSDRSVWPDARATARRVRLARTSVAGEFAIPDVPPGEYLIVAVPDTSTANWPDVSMLTKLVPDATSLRLGAGDRPVVSLSVKKAQ